MNTLAARLAGLVLALVWTTSSPAEDPPQFTGFNGAVVGYAVGPLPERLAQLHVALLNHEQVRDELKLTPDQATAVTLSKV